MTMAKEIDHLRAENKRLREALLTISSCGPGDGPHVSEAALFHALAENCKRIAREALAAAEGEDTEPSDD